MEAASDPRTRKYARWNGGKRARSLPWPKESRASNGQEAWVEWERNFAMSMTAFVARKTVHHIYKRSWLFWRVDREMETLARVNPSVCCAVRGKVQKPKVPSQTEPVSAQVPTQRSAKRGVGITQFSINKRLSHHPLCSATTITHRPQALPSSITSSTTTNFYIVQQWLVPRQVSLSTHVDVSRLIAFGQQTARKTTGGKRCRGIAWFW